MSPAVTTYDPGPDQPDPPDLWAALLLKFEDGSGDTQLIGVYPTETEAQAACWRTIDRLGYHQPTHVVPVVVGVDQDVS